MRMTKLVFVGVLILGMAVVAFNLLKRTAASGSGGESATSGSACLPLEPRVAGNPRTMLPDDLIPEHPLYVDALDRVRSFDGGPYSYVASWIADETGTRVGETPALWIVGGGVSRRDGNRPKDYYVLNDLAVELLEESYRPTGGGRIEGRRNRLLDGRTLSEPFLETDSAAIAVLECVWALTGD